MEEEDPNHNHWQLRPEASPAPELCRRGRDGGARSSGLPGISSSASKFLMNVITVDDYKNTYWPKLESAIDQLLTQSPGDYIPISYEQIYSCVYKCVCQQHSEQMYSDLMCKITRHLEKVSLELQATSPEHYVEKFNLALVQYMGALHSIVPLFIYMNKFYIETKLNRDLKDDLLQLFSTHVAEKHVYSLMPLLLEAQSTPFQITPSTMASIVKGLYTLRPEWVQLAPALFSSFIPNILPAAMESELEDYAAQDQKLQRELMQNGFNRGDQSRKRAGDELSYRPYLGCPNSEGAAIRWYMLSGVVLAAQQYLITDHEICPRKSGVPTTKMNIKQGWRAGAAFLTVMFCFGMLWYLHVAHVDTYIPRSYVNVRAMCTPGDVASKAASVISNYSRNHPVFLQLSDYFWVKNESVYPLPYGTKGSEELLMKFLALSNQYHVPQEIERLRCRRCIVVGNGHRLKNSSLGEIINKYDVVIRLNNAPVHNYEKDVGSKTTMRFFYPESADFDPQLDNNPDTLLVLVPFKPLDIQWMKIILNNEKRVRKGFWKMPPLIWEVTPQNTRILNPYYMEVTASKILDTIIADQKASKKMKAKPTTGMLAITFALHFCDLVDIAGFGYPALSNKKQPIHYYEKVTLKSMAESGHNISLEATAIRNLLQHQLIHNLTYF